MKKVLWFSRHNMTDEQRKALGDVKVTKVNVPSMPNVHVPMTDSEGNSLPPFKVLSQDFDILAIVLPIHLEQQVLNVANGRPVIRANNRRVLVPHPDGGEDKVVFQFDGWMQLMKIEVILEPFQPV